MAKNRQLRNVVQRELGNLLFDSDCTFRLSVAGSREDAKKVVGMLGTLDVNRNYLVRVVFGDFTGYGFDLSQSREMRIVYEESLQLVNQAGSELIADGICDQRFGWYITSGENDAVM